MVTIFWDYKHPFFVNFLAHWTAVTAKRYCGTPSGYGMQFVADLRHGDVTSNDHTKPPSPIGLATGSGCGWEVMEPSFLRSRPRAHWFPSLRTPKEVPGWQTICSRCRREASLHLKATHTWFQFLQRRIQVFVAWEGKCLCVIDDKVEVWCVPSVTHVTCTS
jgi:hypothetical protein